MITNRKSEMKLAYNSNANNYYYNLNYYIPIHFKRRGEKRARPMSKFQQQNSNAAINQVVHVILKHLQATARLTRCLAN